MLSSTVEAKLKALTNICTYSDVRRLAKEWAFRLTREQALKLLEDSSKEINRAMVEAARSVVRERVEQFCIDEEDRQLS